MPAAGWRLSGLIMDIFAKYGKHQHVKSATVYAKMCNRIIVSRIWQPIHENAKIGIIPLCQNRQKWICELLPHFFGRNWTDLLILTNIGSWTYLMYIHTYIVFKRYLLEWLWLCYCINRNDSATIIHHSIQKQRTTAKELSMDLFKCRCKAHKSVFTTLVSLYQE